MYLQFLCAEEEGSPMDNSIYKLIARVGLWFECFRCRTERHQLLWPHSAQSKSELVGSSVAAEYHVKSIRSRPRPQIPYAKWLRVEDNRARSPRQELVVCPAYTVTEATMLWHTCSIIVYENVPQLSKGAIPPRHDNIPMVIFRPVPVIWLPT